MDTDSLLHRLLFGPLTAEKFLAMWADEVGDPSEEVCVEVHSTKLPVYGKSTVYVFRGGLCAVETAKGRFLAYETLERCEEREYFNVWAEFVRGTWTLKLPQEAGVYATKTLEGDRGRDRTLIRHEGRLLDTTCCGGKVEFGRVSNWRAYWFSHPFPPLRGAV